MVWLPLALLRSARATQWGDLHDKFRYVCALCKEPGRCWRSARSACSGTTLGVWQANVCQCRTCSGTRAPEPEESHLGACHGHPRRQEISQCACRSRISLGRCIGESAGGEHAARLSTMSAAPGQTFCLRPGCYAVVDGNEAWFETVHVTAIAILCTSIVSSGYDIARSVLVDKQLDKTGKRFPVFLSACDFCFGLSHICDHVYVYTTRYYPGPSLCALLGALVQIFIAAQAVVVVMTTATLYLQMIHEKKVALGRCDVYLLLAIIAVNAPMIGAGVPLDVFGPSGYWIYLNAAHPNYVVVQLVYVDLPAIVCFGLTAYFATTVHLHIRKFSVAHRNVAHPPGRAPASMAADEPSHVSVQDRKVVKGANRVNLFAALYLAQWFSGEGRVAPPSPPNAQGN